MPQLISRIDDRNLRQILRTLIERCKNHRPLMKAIGEIVVRQTEERFDSQGPAPDGSPWAPLKASTRQRKKHSKILTESGELRGSIRDRLIGNDAVAVGTNKVYGAIHQFGGTISHGARTELFLRNRYKRATKKGRFKKGIYTAINGLNGEMAQVRGFTFRAHEAYIPARPYLGLSPNNRNEIINVVREYLMR